MGDFDLNPGSISPITGWNASIGNELRASTPNSFLMASHAKSFLTEGCRTPYSGGLGRPADMMGLNPYRTGFLKGKHGL